MGPTQPTGSCRATKRLGPLRRGLNLSLLPIKLNQQNGRCITGVLVVAEEIIDGVDGDVVHDFHPRRQEAARGHRSHRLPCCFHRGEIRQQHVHALRSPKQAKGDGRRDAQRSFAADERTT